MLNDFLEMIIDPSVSDWMSRNVYFTSLCASVATKVSRSFSTLIKTPIIACLISSVLVAKMVFSIPFFMVFSGIVIECEISVSGICGNSSKSSQASLYSPLLVMMVRILDSGSLRSEEHTSELQSRGHLVCRLLLEKKKQY